MWSEHPPPAPPSSSSVDENADWRSLAADGAVFDAKGGEGGEKIPHNNQLMLIKEHYLVKQPLTCACYTTPKTSSGINPPPQKKIRT